MVTTMQNSSHKLTAIGIAGVTVLVLWLVLPKGPQKPLMTAPLVAVELPKQQLITEFVTQTGNLVAFNAVNLVARIEGYLNAILFNDGVFVKKDQPLFVIEPEPYLEKQNAANAAVAGSKAASHYAKTEYKRQQSMYKENATSLNSVEKWLANAEETEAQVIKSDSDAKIAAINYSYTHIAAPFDGRIGRHLVDKYNLVGNGQATILATIEQINPIYVYFNLNELDVIRVRKAAHAHGLTPADINKIPVYVSMGNETDFPHEGHLDFVNTGLDASTGTLQFRALLPNPDFILLPGFFVQVRIGISEPELKLTVPQTAILFDQIGAYVLIVNKHNLVELKRVELGALEADRRVVLQGLDAKDSVIVRGLQNATPDRPVSLQPVHTS